MDEHDRTASLISPTKLAQDKRGRPASSSAWLDRMAADAGHQHVRHIGEMSAALRDRLGPRDDEPLRADLVRLAEALPRLDFGLLQARGFMARLSGKSRTAGAEFAQQHDTIDAAAQALAPRVQALGTQAEPAGGDRTLLEFELEFHALDKVIDQAARWLQDMRSQLGTRQVAGGDEAASNQLQDDIVRCELLAARLEALRALSSTAQQVHAQVRAVAARRASLVQMLRRDLAKDLGDWRKRISPLADAARSGQTPAFSLEGAMDCHRDLQLIIKQAITERSQLQTQELALAEGLQALAAHKPAA